MNYSKSPEITGNHFNHITSSSSLSAALYNMNSLKPFKIAQSYSKLPELH